jgi:hypothetical protein
VEVLVEQGAAGAERLPEPDGGRDGVDDVVELGQRPRVAAKGERTSRQILEHRRPVDLLQHEVAAVHLDHLGHRDAVRASVHHDAGFERRDGLGGLVAEALDDAPAAEVVDIGPSPSRHGRCAR